MKWGWFVVVLPPLTLSMFKCELFLAFWGTALLTLWQEPRKAFGTQVTRHRWMTHILAGSATNQPTNRSFGPGASREDRPHGASHLPTFPESATGRGAVGGPQLVTAVGDVTPCNRAEAERYLRLTCYLLDSLVHPEGECSACCV
jgi:hypothetical protein